MKFDFDPDEFDEPDERAPSTQALDPVPRPEEVPGAFPPDVRMYRAFEHAQLRARVDTSRLQFALNQMHHTLEVARAQEETSDSPVPDTFRPEAFRARNSN